MATYIIGDIHGCFIELQDLLAKASFNPQYDELWLTGDLVARGPNSLEVLRFLRSLGPVVRLVLGNHDLQLIAIYFSINRNKYKNYLRELLEAPDADELINWLRMQPMLQVNDKLKIIMTHAGITPQWDIKTAERCAHEVEEVLRSNNNSLLLNIINNNITTNWTPTLSGLARLSFSINALTRMRYCLPSGQLDMLCKDAPGKAPASLRPWFTLPRLTNNDFSLIFGHWASLEGKGTPEGIIGLDTGCCWGGKLTMLRWEDYRYFTQLSKARALTVSLLPK
ncbi:diadenosine tetraphosphatase [Serratia symbiotica str. 'Cinara cedri']|nr:diadenosine tetraphosphatase [Serratia symbiotica str. 'Cinara cedri']